MARSKLNETQKAMSASTKVNAKKRVNIDTSEEKEVYKCWCCGSEFTKLSGNFTPTNFPLFKLYGYYPVCKKCTGKFYPEMVSFFDGSEEKAIEFICSMYGLYFNENPLAASRKISEHRNRFHTYSSKININPWTGRSWLDTLKERFAEEDRPIENPNDIDNVGEQYKLTPKMIKFWGAGYEAKIYPILQGYYDELLKLCPEKPDVKKQKMMKNLCLLEYQMQVNIQAGKDIGTLSNSYKAMFEAAELKMENADTSNDSFGKWIMDIEKYSPAEYYKDQKKYHDFFGIVEYIERFMFRPLKNLIFGEKEKEKEYWIDEDSET